MTKLVICGFPGTGKSTFAQKFNLEDSDSSRWPKENFPSNYVDYLETKDGIILCSTHEEVRQELKRRNIDYIIVLPDHSLKDTYIKRYQDRGSAQAFIDLVSEQWDNFQKSCYEDEAIKVVLEDNEYIENTFPFIMNMFLTHKVE